MSAGLDRSARIRWALVALLVLGAVIRIWRAAIFQGAIDGSNAEVDFEMLSYIGIVSAVVNVGGWAVVVMAVRALHRASAIDGPLRITFWCWMFSLVVDLFFLALPFVGAGAESIWQVTTWVIRGTVLANVVGAFAAITHAKHEGASSETTTLATIGVVTYLAMIVGMELASSESFGWYWTPYVVSIVGMVGLFGGLALLPWTTSGSEEGESFAPGAAGQGEPPVEGSAAQDFLVGALWLGGGLAVTVISMQGEGIGGRAVLAWGPMLYGVFRIFRGFMR